MPKTIGIGFQNFEQLITEDYFYIDKTGFIKEWWEGGGAVTLITRPRRFGKTLMMSMLERFFSVKYAGQGSIFEPFAIWREEKYHKLQGSRPVISLSFANIKEKNYENTRRKIYQLLTDLYAEYYFLLDSDALTPPEKEFFKRVSADMGDVEATLALNQLSRYLSNYYGQKVILLLDEYDTPMQEAYVNGYWEELTAFIRNLFNAAFKTNAYLERAIMTGITRVSKESIFSDLNNLEVITTTSELYATQFGFTEEEVCAALAQYGLEERMAEVKRWYDGFIFGAHRDIYNPWSILNFLKTGRVSAYWANTSSNSLVGKLIREGSTDIKMKMEDLLSEKTLPMQIDEQIVFEQLNQSEAAVWSLFLASGYLRVEKYDVDEERGRETYELALTNREVHIMFERMVQSWFSHRIPAYNDFIKALLLGDVKAMNAYMNKVALASFSFFDTGKHPSSKAEPERFYHGFVLGLLVDLTDRYVVTSNRESGFGRYDVLLEPRGLQEDAVILEFKVRDAEEEASLKDTVKAAKEQIARMGYAASLRAKGIAEKRIRSYGFAFEGKQVLIG